eukprot:COSAG05_NODE_9720_length_606_cov_1.169625_2_plen_43_part_01
MSYNCVIQWMQLGPAVLCTWMYVPARHQRAFQLSGSGGISSIP